MKSMWSGFISFGLINIPVKLYTATEDHGPQFELFHGPDLAPIRYARICRVEGKEVPWSEVVKGYEYREGEYVVLTDEDFREARIEHEKTIDILSFVAEEEIPSVYYEKPYYLEPAKGGARPYALLRAAIEESGKVAIGKFILHNKEHHAVLKTFGDILILNQIRIAEDLRKPQGLNIPQNKVPKQEVDMAVLLIDNLTGRFEPQKYHDTYVDRLMEIIANKAKGRKVRKAKEKTVESTKVVDLMSQLKKSLETEKKRGKKRRVA